MTELEAINQIIESVGETPLQSLGSGHPLEDSAARILEQTSRREQTRGWWFNTSRLILEPAIDGRISVPAQALTVDPLQSRYRYVYRGGFLWNLDAATDVIGHSVEVEMVELVAFVSLPETAAQYFAALATLRFAKAYDADGQKLQTIKDEAALAKVPFHADEIRNADVNLFQSGDTARNLAYIRNQRYILRNG